MIALRELLSNRIADALRAIGAEGDVQIAPAQDEKFGDYQCNAAMAIAKKQGKKPRDVAQSIVEQLRIDDMCELPEIAGPGFINLRLKPGFLAKTLMDVPAQAVEDNDRLGLPLAVTQETIVIDLSSPNLAKEMHVGHLRSTVIGDCIARVLEFEGHNVIRENHVGDWGTQFGMLVAHLRRIKPDVADNPASLVIKDLETFYIEAKARFDADDEFKTEARETVVALQRGDPLIRKIWQAFCNESLRHCHEIYRQLNVRLVDRGESFYNDLMDDVIRRLERLQRENPGGAVRESEGALCIFLDGFTTREGQPLPMIVRKTDGGYNYATSDLATIVDRVERLHANRIIYVVGMSQKQHFEMLFAAAHKVGIAGANIAMEHVGFGNVLAPGGRPFKTREGGTIKLKDLLNEAVDRARRVIDQPPTDDSKRPTDLALSEKDSIAEAVGLGAIKYFDLSHSLMSDYTFDLEIMLSLEGNTAPYMLYAYARIRSIARKAGASPDARLTEAAIALEHPTEIALAKKILQFADVLQTVSRDLRPNVLTDYLFELAKAFSRFYDKKIGVRVIDATPESIRSSRLRLCDLTARVLKLGLHLLGIETIEQM
ncbi:MAG: arginine--tRNA ligase [Planctomycetes bacterium]|nr:arginine--tRNA ligase [Planctomycetota bacterium]